MIPWLLQAPPAPSTIQTLLGFVPMLLVVGIFWFIVIAPMRKQQKQTQEMLKSLKKGDKVLTSGGIYGTVAQIEESNPIVWVKIADTLKVKMTRSSITAIVADGGEDKKES